MALIQNKYCPRCETTSSHVQGLSEENKWNDFCLNCGKIEKKKKEEETEKENRKMLRDGVLSKTRRKAKRSRINFKR